MYKIISTPIIAFVLIGLLVSFADAAKIEELIPANSLLYVTISDFDEIWDEGSVSESWQSIFNSDEADGSLPEMNRVMEMMQFTIGTDLRGIAETFGRRIVFVIMPPQAGKKDTSMALILDTGGLRKEASDIVSNVNAAVTMNDKEFSSHPDLGRYKKIPYGKIVLQERIFRYGFIDDLLVVGLKEGGFKTIVDTYSGKKNALLSHNDKFKNMRKKFANVQLFGYANINNALPFLKSEENDEKSRIGQLQSRILKLEPSSLQSIDVIGFGMDVFSVDGLQKLYVQMKKDAPKTGAEDVSASGLINPMFRGGNSLDFLLSLRSLATLRDADVFFAMSFDNLGELWQSLGDKNDLQEKIRQLEETSGLDFETEILGSLTGEIAISANISDPPAPQSGRAGEIPEGTNRSIPWKELAVLMGLKDRVKWESAVEAMQNLEDAPTQKEYQYKGAIVRKLSLPQNELFDTFEYSLTNETFIASTSTSKMQNIIDKTGNVKKLTETNDRIKQLPAPPSLLLNFNLNKLLPYMLTSGIVNNSTENSQTQPMRDLGAGEYTISPISDGLWICLRIISGRNLIEVFGKIASVVLP